MIGAKHLPAYGRSQLPAWFYLGGQTLTNPSNTMLTIPDDTDSIVISSETGATYYCINNAASSTSPGYIPEDGMQVLGPLANLDEVWVDGATAVVHVQYFREA